LFYFNFLCGNFYSTTMIMVVVCCGCQQLQRVAVNFQLSW